MNHMYLTCIICSSLSKSPWVNTSSSLKKLYSLFHSSTSQPTSDGTTYYTVDSNNSSRRPSLKNSSFSGLTWAVSRPCMAPVVGICLFRWIRNEMGQLLHNCGRGSRCKVTEIVLLRDFDWVLFVRPVETAAESWCADGSLISSADQTPSWQWPHVHKLQQLWSKRSSSTRLS